MAGKNYRKNYLTDYGDRNLPVVALVGRPNVGKSTLFNRLTRSRRAIVDPTPGMTRDRLYGAVERDQGSFRLVDTGGIETRTDLIAKMIRDQTDHAVREASVLVFMIDGRQPLTSSDEDIALALRQLGKPVILFINKMDVGESQGYDTDIYSLGFENTLLGSAEHARGIDLLQEEIDRQLEGKWESPDLAKEEPALRLAIIGRPNVGKSSIVNKLMREERVMVSNIAGTTRDPIDSFLTYDDKTYCMVDTAGIRKRGKISGSQESLSVMMARRQVESADVVALLIDATDTDTSQDAAIAGIAEKAFKPIVVVVNKWDLIKDKDTHTIKSFEEKIRRRLKFLESSPFVFVSAMTGQRVTRVLEITRQLYQSANKRITTGVLNRFVDSLAKNKRMPSHKGRLLKIYYITQAEVNPPTFVAATNTRDMHFTQERFLMNRIREAFELEGVPIRLINKPKNRDREE